MRGNVPARRGILACSTHTPGRASTPRLRRLGRATLQGTHRCHWPGDASSSFPGRATQPRSPSKAARAARPARTSAASRAKEQLVALA